jgi:hypothetical protein
VEHTKMSHDLVAVAVVVHDAAVAAAAAAVDHDA